MKKKKPLLICILIFLAVPLLMAPSPPSNASLWWESKGSKFDINNAEIEIFFGQNRSKDVDFSYDMQEEISVFLYNGGSYIWFDDGQSLAALNSDPNFYLIRAIPPEEFYSDDYYVSWIHPWSCSCSSFKETFNHSEKIIIPEGLFNQESGIITIIIRIGRVRSEDGEEVFYVAEREGDYRVIYYKKEEQKVRISQKEFK